MELVIKRSEWQRGAMAEIRNPNFDPEDESEDYQDSHLELETEMLRSVDQKKCCLGFAALACGYTPGEVVGTGTPSGVVTRAGGVKGYFDKLVVQRSTHHLSFYDSTLTDRLIGVNDDDKLPEAKREAEITALFAEIGVTVRFED